MADDADKDGYDTIFVISGDENLLKNCHNENYVSSETLLYENGDTISEEDSEYGDRGTPPPQASTQAVLRITTKHEQLNPSLGFVIGSDPTACDIVLDHGNISRKHFAVQVNVASRLTRIKNFSQHGTRAYFNDQKDASLVKSTQVLLSKETASVDFGGGVRIDVRRNGNPDNWRGYCATLRDAVENPSLATLKLASSIATTATTMHVPTYITGDKIGSGGFGDVYKITDKHTADVYAMKVFKNKGLPYNELDLLSSLNHDYVVKYKAFIHDSEPEDAKLMMEYVEGNSLDEFLTTVDMKVVEKLNSLEMTTILQQLLEAVAYLHGKKVIHRDIKPANIILVSRNPVQIKLVDFGLATDSSRFRTRCGTHFYAAPEIVDRRFNGTNKVDIYAIGAVALELYGTRFCLSLPAAADPEDWRSYLKEGQNQRDIYAGNSDPFIQLAVRMMSDKAINRPTAQQALGHSIFHNVAYRGEATPCTDESEYGEYAALMGTPRRSPRIARNLRGNNTAQIGAQAAFPRENLLGARWPQDVPANIAVQLATPGPSRAHPPPDLTDQLHQNKRLKKSHTPHLDSSGTGPGRFGTPPPSS